MHTEANVVFLGELLADLEHGGHATPGGGQQQKIVRVCRGAHEGVGDVAAHPELAQLLQQVVQVQIPVDWAPYRTLFGTVLYAEGPR